MRRQHGRQYRSLLDVLANTPTRDAKGQAIESWGLVFQIYGDVKPARGDKSAVAGQPTANVTHEIKCPYRDGVLAQHRLRWRPFTFTAVAATDVITVSGRSLVTGERVRVSSSGTLPGGLTADLDLFVISASGSTGKLAATHHGGAIDITLAGTGTHYFAERLFDVVSVLDREEQRRELVMLATERK